MKSQADITHNYNNPPNEIHGNYTYNTNRKYAVDITSEKIMSLIEIYRLFVS